MHAPLGLRAARVYAQIAPAASHAQHMISHIYVALGEWAESVDANVKSFDVSAERRQRKDLDIDALNYHSLHWLMYSYLQLGRFEEARVKLDMMTGYARASRSPRALWYHAAMRAAADLFASGYVALRAGDTEKAIALFEEATATVQFEKALVRAPRRSLSLAGLAKASKASGADYSAQKTGFSK